MSSSRTTLEFVIPIYNEEECLPTLLSRLRAFREKLKASVDVSFLFINDGSRDRTLELLVTASHNESYLKVLDLSRNFGHQIALTAGVDAATADVIAIIDGDLQDPPELVEPMLELAEKGYDIVFGKRRERKGESWFKLTTAALFYKLIRSMCRVDIPENTGDFRIMKKRAYLALRQMRESHRFIRGMVPWTGFKSTYFLYDRDSRFAGETKYPLKKMIRFALDAIFSFSNTPLRIASYSGIVFLAVAMLVGLYILFLKAFTNEVVPGLTVLIMMMIGMSGFQVLMLGVLGEYVGRIFESTKNRPLYFLNARLNFSPESE